MSTTERRNAGWQTYDEFIVEHRAAGHTCVVERDGRYVLDLTPGFWQRCEVCQREEEAP